LETSWLSYLWRRSSSGNGGGQDEIPALQADEDRLLRGEEKVEPGCLLRDRFPEEFQEEDWVVSYRGLRKKTRSVWMTEVVVDAEEAIGGSISWKKGIEVSIEKWKTIVKGRASLRGWDTKCGLCVVARNRGRRRLKERKEFSLCKIPLPYAGHPCPLHDMNEVCCREFTEYSNSVTIKLGKHSETSQKKAEVMLRRIKGLRKKKLYR
jgi:hypothetical protein